LCQDFSKGYKMLKMTESNKRHYEMVVSFQKLIGAVSSYDSRLLYTKLFAEEFTEFLVALEEWKLKDKDFQYNENTIIECIDGISDMKVILLGSIYHESENTELQSEIYKMCEDELVNFCPDTSLILDQAFTEVMVSNFSKFPKDMQEAKDTVLKYKSNGIETKIEPVTVDEITYYTVLSSKNHTGDGPPLNKLLKSINYRQPDLQFVISALE